jgi:hypothetical protein
LFVLLVAGAAGAAQTYRWVDERGVVTYGETPPPGRPAKPIDTLPQGPVDRPAVKEKPREAEAPRVREAPPQAVAPAPVPPTAAPARGMTFQTFIQLHNGMTEAELMLRAGRPDHESVENLFHDIVKSYYYYPTVSDPFITVVTVRGGRIVNLERNRKMF